MEAINSIVVLLNDYYWNFLIVLLLVAGVWWGFRTVIVQIRMLPEMFKAITEKPGTLASGSKGVSAFTAFTISAASRVGTGNVAGVAVAITMGGPGAVFWMWLIAILGGATSFVESTLGQLYKVKDKDSFRGGPAYYITTGLGWKPFGVLFAVLIILTYGFVFNAVQANSISATVGASLGMESLGAKIVIGLVLASIAGVILFGGIKRIGKFSQVVVPVMASAYILIGLVVVLLNITEVPGMIALIFQSAFGLREIGGAAIGAAMMAGIRRGLFSNEAGMGSTPNAAATASVSHPVKQGLVQTLGVYFDTLVVCSVTAFVILLATPHFGEDIEGATLTQRALSEHVGGWGTHFITIVLFFLALSSVIGNYYYGQSNIEFLSGNKSVMLGFRILVVICVFLGAVGSVPLVWNTADLFMAAMATVNLIALFPLGGLAVLLLRNYLQQAARGENPVFHRDDLPQAKNVECWDGTEDITKPQGSGSWT